VGGGEVDPVAADPVLRHDRDPAGGQPVAHVLLERVQLTRAGGPARRPAGTRVLQVVGQHPGARLRYPIRVDVVAGERADQGEPTAGPGGGHVQPALAAVTQQRAPLVPHPAVRVLAVPDRQDDQLHDLVDLGHDRDLLARLRALGDHDVPQAVVADHPRERDQRAAVDPGVGERHQPLVAAAVVPGQRPGRQQRAQRVQHRLEPGAERHQALVAPPLSVVIFAVVALVADLAEEAGRRQLAVVPGHDDLVCAHDRRDRIGRDDLAGLVEDHYVEHPGQREIMRNFPVSTNIPRVL
jgi:hypothetical protein